MPVIISRVLSYPIKGFGALHHCYNCSISNSGRIGADRQWWLELRDDGTVVNGKWAVRNKYSRFFQIDTQFDEPLQSVRLTRRSTEGSGTVGEPSTIPLSSPFVLAEWFSEALNQKVRVKEDRQLGRPDDLELPSFTLLSEASARSLAEWFHCSVDEVIARFRPNLLIDGVRAFEEYSFLGKQLHLSGAQVALVQACQRCSVPGVEPRSGKATKGYSKNFGPWMRPQLQKWAPAELQGKPHGFYACINTKMISCPPGACIQAGQEVEIV